MTVTEPPDDATMARLRRRWIAAGVLVVAVIAAVAIFASFVPRGADGTTPSTSPTNSTAATPSVSPSPARSGSPSAPAGPGGTATPAPSASVGSSAPSPGSTRAIGQPAPVVAGITVTVGSLKAVQGEATRPGDIAAPSVQFTVTVANSTAASVSLASAVLTVDYATTDTPASQLPGPGGTSFPTSLASGQTATATFVFSVPLDQRNDVHITFDYAAGIPTVVFSGVAPTD